MSQVEDDPEFASPACYAHETDPAYAGYLTGPELLALLLDLRAALAARHAADPELARLDAEIARLGGDPAADKRGSDPDIFERARAALPKIADDGVYGLVKAVIGLP